RKPSVKARLQEVAAVRLERAVPGIVQEVLGVGENRLNPKAQYVVGIEYIEPALQVGRLRNFADRWIGGNVGTAGDIELHLFEESDLRPDGDEHLHLEIRSEMRESVVDDLAAETVGDNDELGIFRGLLGGCLAKRLQYDVDNRSGRLRGS